MSTQLLSLRSTQFKKCVLVSALDLILYGLPKFVCIWYYNTCDFMLLFVGSYVYFAIVIGLVITLTPVIIYLSDTTSKYTPFMTIKEDTYVTTRFAVCSSYWEQQTNAIMNMWSLQKWAKMAGFKVLQPFAYQSTLGITPQILQDYDFTNVLNFSDYFDMDYWNNMAKKNYGIPPLEKWNTFVQSPLKKTVVVILTYDVFPVGVYTGSHINDHAHCVEEKKRFYNEHTGLFDRFQIQVVRNVCFVFNYQGKSSLTLHQFNSYLILNDANVWFSFWRGIQYDRIPISDHKVLERAYGGEKNVLAMVKTSSRVLRDSQKYVNTVLHVELKQYTAVAFRTTGKKNYLVSKGYSRKNVMQYFQKCGEEIKNELLKHPSSAKFLAIDLGKFGDLTSVYGYFKVNNEGNELFKFILKNVYGNKSIDDYHNELIRAADGKEDSGYIGSLEKTIAINAKRLIVVGGKSSFQRSMMAQFREKNQNCKYCVKFICYNK